MTPSPEVRSDAELMVGAAEDPDLFRFIYDRYAERMYRFFFRRTGDRDVGLDLTAETFAQAWMSKERFRDLAGGSAGPWLFAIARRLLIASVEQRRLELKAIDKLQVEVRPHPTPTAAPTAEWLDGLEADLAEALADLPAAQRQAVGLRVVGGLTYKAIGVRAGCTSTAARIRVSRGLKRLRARLEANGT
jgi:RNA polymerase sigma factor (sigma-70 family)